MIHRLRHMVLLLALTGLFCSCSQVEDARRVVAEADSLRAVGTTYDDSLSIAEAAATLSHVRYIYPTDYARANYYYGRLLREAGNHPEAMLAFLRVVHSRTEDHEIKARAYSNMGTMCHLACNYILSYDMYEKCAMQFLISNNQLAYFYALNNMAYELAENKNKDEAVTLTRHIENECANSNVLTKIWETRANAYLHAEMYDSTIICVNKLHSRGNNEPTGTLLKARAFSYMGIQDSAVYYAEQVARCSNSWFDLNNAYYILANDDTGKNKEEALQFTRDRSDIQKLIEIRQGKLSQATQLLEQDLNRKPNMAWLWATIVTLLIIGIPSSVFISRKRKKHQLYSQKATAAQEEHRILSEQNQLLEAKQEQRQNQTLEQIERYCNSIEVHDFRKQLCWDDYKEMCAIINHYLFGLVNKLNAAGLKKKEIQLCVLVAIGKFSGRKMANILCYAENSIRGAKEDVAIKLGTTSKNLRSYLLKMAIEG